MDLRLLILSVLVTYSQCKLVNMSCRQISVFVNGHNSRRNLLAAGRVQNQPAAADMKIMQWDDELAAKAAKWASKNQFSHNPDRNIASGRFNTGENLYMYSTTASDYKFDVDAALKSWFEEHKDFVFKPLAGSDFNRADNVQIGHYTQMVWANTVYVGCGLSQWTDNKGWHHYLVVCNYGPGGNFIGQTPYKKGNGPGTLTCGTSDCNRLYGDKC